MYVLIPFIAEMVTRLLGGVVMSLLAVFPVALAPQHPVCDTNPDGQCQGRIGTRPAGDSLTRQHTSKAQDLESSIIPAVSEHLPEHSHIECGHHSSNDLRRRRHVRSSTTENEYPCLAPSAVLSQPRRRERQYKLGRLRHRHRCWRP
ncbi:hypothetical protein P280DRAFT_173222 [Massarina eburnea CBS 473.64]|uniref:Uncharacterized protein n=1 Tax=Massarina eburnea CBS 473.64 TaxID=1395130 RepID=A0A6A6SDN9_9PLEO|nr:hypothetical protein P280DRAFT_173222 [Massarina eburnea CBS 473.64]